MFRSVLKRLLHETLGAALVESALGAAICILAFLWMMEFAMCMYDQTILQDAAQEGVMYAVTHGAAAYKNSGHGSGPGTSDPTGANSVIPATEAWFAQSALKSSLPNLSVCVRWWAPGTVVGGYAPSECSGNSASYSSSWGNAEPGTVVTVQVSWPYKPYIKLPWVPATLSYTSTGAVVY